MVTRRLTLLASLGGFLAVAGDGFLVPPARAASVDDAKEFISRLTRHLVEVLNRPGPLAEKQAALQEVVDQDVDVAGVAKFCLGRFWRQATPQQQSEYIDLFRRVLMVNITGKISEYQGVSLAVDHAAAREGSFVVSTTVYRPGSQPAQVDWVVDPEEGGLKIVDVVAEGTSLRLTQRSDYAAFIARNGNNVQALIDAMRHQASGQPS
jgi:phospholipid transport system substrate-binding protein